MKYRAPQRKAFGYLVSVHRKDPNIGLVVQHGFWKKAMNSEVSNDSLIQSLSFPY